MNQRQMTPLERSELEQAIRSGMTARRLAQMSAISTLAACFCGSTVDLAVKLAFKATGALATSQTTKTAIWAGIAATIVLALSALADLVSRFRQEQRARRQMKADIDAGMIEEETVQLSHVIRLLEAEHFTELLVLQTEDGRLRALLDDTTPNINGRSAKSSKLQLARTMRVLRFPLSGRETTYFDGEVLRRPKPRITDPTGWPADDRWYVGDNVGRVLARIGVPSEA